MMRDTRVLCIVCLAAVIITVVIAYAAVETVKIHKEEAIAIEHEKTEQVEERAQFWQQLVPWGEDEAEESK